jgi:MbtH protein
LPVGGDAQGTYLVVVNDEEQYSIWPEGQPIPAGWREADRRGSKADCLAYVEEVWTDMRPLSLRRAMDEPAGG